MLAIICLALFVAVGGRTACAACQTSWHVVHSGIDMSFVAFGPAHWVGVIVVACVAVGLPIATLLLASPTQRRWLEIGLAFLLVAHVVVNAWVRSEFYGQPIQQHLPLHLCGASMILSVMVLLFHSYRAYEITYFWGLGGAIPALITPDVEYTFPHPFFVMFFTGHGLELTGVTFATIAMGFRPRSGSVARAIVATGAYASIILPLNYLLHSNYLYLRHKPEQSTLIDGLGPWPWYILSLAILAVLIAVVLYLPFATLIKRRDENTSGR